MSDSTKREFPNDNFAAVRIPEFRWFVIGRLLLTISIQIQGVAVGWQIYDLTKDPLALGFIGLAEVIPAISVSLYAGHLADIVSRKKIAVYCLIVLVFCSLSLVILNMPVTQQVVLLSPIYFYIIIFITGIARGFASPAIASITPQIVPRALYANASAWNSTMWETGSISGPALGGLLYSLFGANFTYAIDTTLLILALVFFQLLISRPPGQTDEDIPLKESLSKGLRFVFKNDLILSAMSLDMFAVLFGGAIALLPIFASEILNTGPEGLGLLRAAPSFGALTMALYLTHRSIGENAGKKLLIAVALFGISMIGFGLSTHFYLSLFLLALSGVFDCVSVVIRSVIMQTYVPDDMRGRVSSVNQIFIGSSNEIGALESGVAAKLFGVVRSVVIGGIITIGIAAIVAKKSKSLYKLNRIETI